MTEAAKDSPIPEAPDICNSNQFDRKCSGVSASSIVELPANEETKHARAVLHDDGIERDNEQGMGTIKTGDLQHLAEDSLKKDGTLFTHQSAPT
jgi:hypothetical protein